MPITLPPISRRSFLTTTIAAGTALSVRSVFADNQKNDANRFALLADTHVAADREFVSRGVNVAEHLKATIGQIVADEKSPAGVIVAGDCAYKSGEAGDYKTLVGMVSPLSEAGVPVHFALGNHDHRERFWEAMPPKAGQDKLVESKHLTIVETASARFFLLDSLDRTDVTPGLLGESQQTWLAGQLEQRADKPAIVVVHHNPDTRPRTSGLTDTTALMEVLKPAKHVKALMYGHTHNWAVHEDEGVQLINLPPVAYVFNKTRPSGWVDMRLEDNGAKLKLHSLDPTHAEHGQEIELAWRR
jgi:Icc protein